MRLTRDMVLYAATFPVRFGNALSRWLRFAPEQQNRPTMVCWEMSAADDH